MLSDIYSVQFNEYRNEFYFTTSLGYLYNVYFLPAKDEYFSDFPEVPNNIYLFGFSLQNANTGQLPFDAKVAQTICHILVDFFTDKRNIIIFICDSTDKKERNRYITFNKWFHKFDVEQQFEKIDKILEYDSDNHYYLSLIYRKDNLDIDLYLNAFLTLTSNLEK